jgi:hypothetical protein
MSFARLVRSLVTVGAVAASIAEAQRPAPANKELYELTHAVVVDSLTGGGWQEDQIFVAVDSASLALLVLAKVPATLAEQDETVTCPGSTLGTSGKVLTNVGYRVKVELQQSEDKAGWILSVNKSCGFVYQGRDPRGFLHGGTWEIRKVNGSWRIIRQLHGVIT